MLVVLSALWLHINGGRVNKHPTRDLPLPFIMVAYCTTTQAGETCTHDDCSYRHNIIRCEPCSCSFPAKLLDQHSNGKRHVRNAAANGSSSSITPNRPPPPPSNL